MSKTNKNTQNNATVTELSPEERRRAAMLEFDPRQLKGFDDVHVTIAELIKEDLLLLLEKHLPQILSARGYDHDGREVRGGRSRTQQTLLGLLKGPFAQLFEGSKKRGQSAALQEKNQKIAELEAQLAAIIAANKK